MESINNTSAVRKSSRQNMPSSRVLERYNGASPNKKKRALCDASNVDYLGGQTAAKRSKTGIRVESHMQSSAVAVIAQEQPLQKDQELLESAPDSQQDAVLALLEISGSKGRHEVPKQADGAVDFAKSKARKKPNTWDESFSELTAFRAKYKHVNVPSRDEYKNLYCWLRHQHYRYCRMNNLPVPDSISRKGFSPLSADECKKLTDLGVDFENRSSAKTNSWDEYFSELTAFKAKYKHVIIPSYGEYKNLYSWLRRQKFRYCLMQNLPVPESYRGYSPLGAAEHKKLKDLGVNFEDCISMQAWDESFSELEAFKAKYKHLDVPRAGEYRGLYNWLREQHYRYCRLKNLPVPDSISRKGCSPLGADEYKKLTDLGVDFE